MSRVAVLTYHALDSTGSVLSVSPSEFRAHVEAVARSGRPVIPPSRLAHPFEEAPPIDRDGFVFTFDDGFASVAELAAPVLAERGFPYVLFLVTTWVGRTNDWPGQPGWVVRAPLMGWDAAGRLASAGAEIAVHTMDHPDLSALSESAIVEQLDGCAREVESRLGTRPRLFAYPGGRADGRCRRIAAARFEAAFGTRHARMSDGDDRFDIPRIETYYFRDRRRFEHLLSPRIDRRLASRRLLRRLRRLG
ncbi:MAG TPA: polysaccharide deacetylase family protein [Thermoanaerobaculia bacterium]